LRCALCLPANGEERLGDAALATALATHGIRDLRIVITALTASARLHLGAAAMASCDAACAAVWVVVSQSLRAARGGAPADYRGVDAELSAALRTFNEAAARLNAPELRLDSGMVHARLAVRGGCAARAAAVSA